MKLLKQKWMLFLFSILLCGESVCAQDFLGEVKKHKELNNLVGGHAFCSAKLGSQQLDSTSYRSNSLVPLASVSKLITSYWALARLGPFYRFETKFYIHRVDSKTIDLHIIGSRDPYYTYEKMFFIVSELNRLGIKKIRNISYDENFTVYMGHRDPVSSGSLRAWSEDQELVTGVVDAEKTQKNIELIFDTSKWTGSALRRYIYTQKLAKTKGVVLINKPSMSFEKVLFVANQNFNESMQKQTPDSSLSMKSAPLFRYLKDMNNFSNNYVADQLFLFLGGAGEFAKFAKEKLNLAEDDLRIYTGSGLPLRSPVRSDNHGTCQAVIKIIEQMGVLLNNYKLNEEEQKALGKNKLELLDTMLVAGVDETEKINGTSANTTYSGTLDQEGSVLAKTGLINSAVNIAGVVYTAEGIYFFGIFLRTSKDPSQKSPAAAAQARVARKNIISDLISHHGGAKKLPLSDHWSFMPIDNVSQLTPDVSSKQLLLGLK